MEFVITFLEGLISFLSPCMLPMLPIYLSYFACGADQKHKVFLRALSFVIGFTTIFTSLGLFAGTLGSILQKYRMFVHIVCGGIVIVFGLSYLQLIPLPFFKGMQRKIAADSIVSAFLFGVVYSVSLTPCIGAFLGSALAMASISGTALRGVLLLIVYSLGMGIPFLITALLVEKLGSLFSFIKRHYQVVNTVCGCFLILVGVCMMFGWLDRLVFLFV